MIETILGWFFIILIPLYTFLCIYGYIRIRMDVKSGKLCPDWKGRPQKFFRWSTFRREWGRMCYVTDCMGNTRHRWWEWENE